MYKPRILVLDADSNAGLAVLQSLGAAGYDCILGATKTTAPAFTSRWADKAVVYPDPMTDAPAFKAWMSDWVRTNDVDLIIPVTECTLVPLHEMRDDEVLLRKTAIPSKETLDLVLDKERLRALADELSIPVPASAIISSERDLDDGRIDEWLSEGAAVVKPIKSKVWTGDSATQLPVVIARSREELLHFVRERIAHVPVQVQQWVPGNGQGVEFLAKDGEIVISMAHERLHEVPLTGGGSSYRKTIETPPALYDDARKLAKALRYTGVAMVEFRREAATGRRWLVEINARFWGSLPLAIFAGVDFPRALVEMLVENKRPSQLPPRTDVYARQIDRDLEWLKQTIKRRGRFTREDLTQPLGRSLLEWGRIMTGKETWDGASLRDPAPILHELRQVVGNELGTAIGRTRKLAVQTAARRTSVMRAARYPSAHRVLFICYGNICRSPYAEYRMRSGGGNHDLRSAGFHKSEERRTTDRFLRAAQRRGVDLSTHRSRRVRPADLEWAELIVLMDQRNYDHLAKMDTASLKKVVWLGALEGRSVEIDDPYDLDDGRTEEVLGRMDRCLQRLRGGRA